MKFRHLLLLLCAFPCGNLSVASTLPSQEFLQDSTGIQVTVVELGDWLKESGLTADAIAQKATFVLRTANLRVASDEDAEILKISIQGLAAKIGTRNYGTFYSVTFELMQYTSQIGNQKLLRAITWRAHDLGVSPDERTLRQDILESVESQAQALANAIHAAKAR